MESRSINQVKVFLLCMNPMTGRCEESALAAIAYDKQSLINWMNGEKEDWQDGQWNKSFKKGSALEWYNPIYSAEEPDMFGQGIHEQWATQEDVERKINESNNSYGFIRPIHLVKEGI